MESGARSELVRAARHGALIGLWIGGLGLAYYAVTYYVTAGGLGQDAHAYWLTAHRPELYGQAPNTKDAYLYSPVFAQVVWPLAKLPWPVFLAVWMSLEALAFAWLLKPLRWQWAIPIGLLCVPEVLVGNVVGLVAVAVVLGMSRRPGFWAIPMLTKVSLAGVGAVWFVARGEWRQVFVAGAWTASIVGISVATWPDAWAGWIRLLTTTSSGRDVLIRTVLALAFVAVSARRGWWWAIPCALVAVTPVLNATQPLLYLVALVRLRRQSRESWPNSIPAGITPSPVRSAVGR